MNFFTRLYIDFRFTIELIGEMICNSFRFTPLGPKKFTNLPQGLKGKVVVITGANTGIGKVTARVMTQLGAKVLIGCRDMTKAYRAVQEIKDKVVDANIEALELDLSSLASVRRFAKEVCEQVSHIDILINNAGVMFCPKWTTKEGFEMQFGTNHLGHFLLTLLLMDKLKNSTKARVVNVSSIAHIRGEINFDDINLNKHYDKHLAYSHSKLANVLFSRQLAARLTDTNINVYCLHPGLISTDLYRHMDGMAGMMTRTLQSVVQIDAELGAQTTLYCALEEALDNESGLYYKNCRRVDNMVANAVDDESARRLWKLSCDLVDIEDKHRL